MKLKRFLLDYNPPRLGLECEENDSQECRVFHKDLPPNSAIFTAEDIQAVVDSLIEHEPLLKRKHHTLLINLLHKLYNTLRSPQLVQDNEVEICPASPLASADPADLQGVANAMQARASNRIERSASAKVETLPESGNNEYLIDQSEVELIQLIGEGSTATVYLGRYCGEHIAVKEIQGVNDAHITAFQRELDVLIRVHHPNIVKFHGVISMPDNPLQSQLQICLEYCEGGSLWDLLYNKPDMQLAWWQRIVMLYDTATAVAHMHSFTPKVIHRDLKSLNVLLLRPVVHETVEPHVKLCDFGFARELYAGCTDLTAGAGTSHWMAPEVLSGSQYTEMADSFSFAVICYEVMCRRIPFFGEDLLKVQELLSKGVRPLPEGVHSMRDEYGNSVAVPPGLIDLINKCWQQEPHRRPSFTSIYMDIVEVSRNTPVELKEATPPKLYPNLAG